MTVAAFGTAVRAAPAGVFIPEGPLADALRLAALASGATIVFPPDAVAGRRVPALRLRGDAAAMVDRLLDGSGLRARRLPGGALLVEQRPPRPARPSAPPAAGETIVVTALRRPTILADTPLSLVDVSAADLRRTRAFGLGGLAALAPGLAAITPGAGLIRLSLRGVLASGEPTVGLYYGNVPIAGPGGSTGDPSLMTPDIVLADIERAEILRGPQGTLYGSGSLSGTLHLVFAPPRLGDIEAVAEAGVAMVSGGGTDGLATAMVNLPLVPDRLGIRALVCRDHRAGSIDNDVLGLADWDRSTRTGGRLMAGFEPEPGWRLDIVALHQWSAAANSPAVSAGLAADRSVSPVRTPFSDRFTLFSLDVHREPEPLGLDLTLAHTVWSPVRTLDFTQALLSHRGDPVACQQAFKLEGAACSPDQQAWFSDSVSARTPTVLDQPMAVITDTAEGRLSGRGRLTWTAGLFASRRRDHGTSTARTAASDGRPDAAHEPPVSMRTFSGSLRQAALFADGSYALSPQWTLSAGGRWFHYRRVGGTDVTIANMITGPFLAEQFHKALNASGGVGRLHLAVRPAPALLFYVQLASGFRPGGINVIPGLPAALATYRDDRLTSIEAGGRAMLGADTRLDLAVYQQRWTDMQYNALTADGSYGFIANLGRARIRGAEATLRWPLAGRFGLRIEAAYNDARLTSDQTAGLAAPGGRRGDQLPYVAPLAATAALTFDRPVDGRLRMKASIDARYSGGTRAGFPADPGQPATRIGNQFAVDAAVGGGRDGLDMMLFVQNLTGDRSVLWAGNQLGQSSLVRARPRSVGLSIRADR